MILRSLGLLNAKDTIVGNNELRGVSGGERRRVTLGEWEHGALKSLKENKKSGPIRRYRLWSVDLSSELIVGESGVHAEQTRAIGSIVREFQVHACAMMKL